MTRLLRHPAFPRLFQALTAAFAILGGAALFAGPSTAEYNAGSWLLWLVWWPLATISFPVAGRLWCAVCPTSLFADLLSRPPVRGIPEPAFLSRYRGPLVLAILALFHFLTLWFDFEENPAATRMLVTVLASCALLFTLVFRERIWCRSLCPAGVLGGLLSPLAPRRVVFEPGNCREGCADGSCGALSGWPDRCPTIDDPRRGIDPQLCTLCGNCLKDCPEAFGLQKRERRALRTPDGLRASESAGGLLLAGIGLDAILVHLRDWPIHFWQATSAIGIEPARSTEILFHAALILLPAAAAGAVAAASGGRAGFRAAWSRLGSAALALAAVSAMSLALRDLLVASPRSLEGVSRAAQLGLDRWLGFGRVLDGVPILLLQAALVAIGLRVSFAILSNPVGESGEREIPSFAERGWCLAVGAILLFLLSRPALA